MFEYNTRVNFYNCDPAGIIFYGEVFKFAHTAYELFFLNLATKKDYFNDSKVVMPIIKTNARYIKPLKSGDEIKITVSVTQLKEKSFELTYNIFNKENDLCVIVETVHVFVDKITFSKINLDEELNNKLMQNLIKNF